MAAQIPHHKTDFRQTVAMCRHRWGVVPPGKNRPEVVAAIGGAFLLIIVVHFSGVKSSHTKGDGQLKISNCHRQARRLQTTHSTSSVFGSGQYWVPPPPDEDMKVERSMKRKKRSKQKKLGTKHKSKISVGFEEVCSKRVSTFDKFLAAKGLQPASRDYSGVTKKRGPSMRHIAVVIGMYSCATYTQNTTTIGNRRDKLDLPPRSCGRWGCQRGNRAAPRLVYRSRTQ